MEDSPNDRIEELTRLSAEKFAKLSAEERDAIYDNVAKYCGRLTKDQLLSIDLKQYDVLRTYPGGDTDWQLMRDRVLFLQTALRSGIPSHEVAAKTIPYFGSILKPPFEAVVQPLELPPYQPPTYDLSRQTPADWAHMADAGWRKHRDELMGHIQDELDRLIESGELRVFKRPRVSRESTPKAEILDERIAYEMAVKNFFGKTQWTALADQYPPESGFAGNPIDKARQKKRRANQIRTRVMAILKVLGLPILECK